MPTIPQGNPTVAEAKFHLIEIFCLIKNNRLECFATSGELMYQETVLNGN